MLFNIFFIAAAFITALITLASAMPLSPNNSGFVNGEDSSQLFYPKNDGLDGLVSAIKYVSKDNVNALDITTPNEPNSGGAFIPGAGDTVGSSPAAVAKTVHTIDHSTGAIGTIDRTVFGN